MPRKHIRVLGEEFSKATGVIENHTKDIDEFNITLEDNNNNNNNNNNVNPVALRKQFEKKQVLIFCEFLAGYCGVNLKKDNETNLSVGKNPTHVPAVRPVVRAYWQANLKDEAFTTERFSHKKRTASKHPLWQEEIKNVIVDRNSETLTYDFLQALKKSLVEGQKEIKLDGESSLWTYLAYIDFLTGLPVFDSTQDLNEAINKNEVSNLTYQQFLEAKGLTLEQQAQTAQQNIIKRFPDWQVNKQQAEKLINNVPEWKQATEGNEVEKMLAIEHLKNLANVLRILKYNGDKFACKVTQDFKHLEMVLIGNGNVANVLTTEDKFALAFGGRIDSFEAF